MVGKGRTHSLEVRGIFQEVVRVVAKTRDTLALEHTYPFSHLRAVDIGRELVNGRPPAEPTLLLTPTLVTRDNVASY